MGLSTGTPPLFAVLGGRTMGQHRENPLWNKHASPWMGASLAALLLQWKVTLCGATCALEKYLHFGSHVEFCLLPHGKEGNSDLILAQDPDPHMPVEGDEDGFQRDIGS